MTLPASFTQLGFVEPKAYRGNQKRRLMLGIDGPPDTGKTEFALSAPGPLAALCLDRGLDPVLDNPRPPATRCKVVGVQVVAVPKATQMAQPQYLEYWQQFYNKFKATLENADVRSLLLDGDSDSWELQRLAEFGRLAKVPPTLYDNVNAARRAMYARAYDSGKIVIATNKVRKVYIDKLNPATLQPEVNSSGNIVREWNGQVERQGFSDQEYLWNIQLRSLRRDDGVFGIRILKCKVDPKLAGQELWGDECNLQTLLEFAYPHIPLSEWGY